MTQDTRIGLIGAGQMGHGIATNILKAGYPLTYLERSGNKSTRTLQDAGATPVATGQAVATVSDVIIVCVTGAPEVEDVLMRPDGVIAGLHTGTTVIDCSTSIPSVTCRLAEQVIAAGGHFLDAPMTRTPKEAAEGRLNLIVGGDAELFQAHLPLLRCFAENIVHAGAIGAGHTMKLLHNFVSLGFSAVLAETAAASARAGIDPAVLHEVLSKGGGNGVILDRITPYLLEGDTGAFRFTIGNCAKDLGYYTAMTETLGAADGVASAVKATYVKQSDAGFADRTVPELIALLGDKTAS
ncbi:MAG: 3-hydroxyisobutyrate dehydrogenase [Paracoccaceae bacterium]|jgi:3-hydroxyisobutyrate dehydrogenase